MTELVRDVALTDDTVRGLELLASSLDWPCYVVELSGCIDKSATARAVRRRAAVSKLVRPELGRVLRLPHRPRECAPGARLRDRAAPCRRTAGRVARGVRHGPVDPCGCGQGMERPRRRDARVRRDCLTPRDPRHAARWSGISRRRAAPAPGSHRRSTASESARPASCRRH